MTGELLRSVGTIEGLLVGDAERGRDRFHVEDRRGRRVDCRVPAGLLSTARHALGSRVAVRGTIWSRADGTPEHMEAWSLDVLEPDAELPRASDVRGILHGLAYGASD